MRNIKSLVFVALIAIVAGLSSCKKEVTYTDADIIGTWQEVGTEAFMCFTNESESGEYRYGYEWNEAEDVFPEDLKVHGNGWFKWKIVKADLTQIHLMDNGGAEIPKVYNILKLNDTDLQIEDEFSKKHTYQKVANRKK